MARFLAPQLHHREAFDSFEIILGIFECLVGRVASPDAQMAGTRKVFRTDLGTSAPDICKDFGASLKRPLFHTPSAVTREPFAASIACKAPQDLPITAIRAVSSLPKYLLPARPFSLTAQSMAWTLLLKRVPDGRRAGCQC